MKPAQYLGSSHPAVLRTLFCAPASAVCALPGVSLETVFCLFSTGIFTIRRVNSYLLGQMNIQCVNLQNFLNFGNVPRTN